MAEAHQRGFVPYSLDGQVDIDEVVHGQSIVNGIFERVPLMKEIGPQHT